MKNKMDVRKKCEENERMYARTQHEMIIHEWTLGRAVRVQTMMRNEWRTERDEKKEAVKIDLFQYNNCIILSTKVELFIRSLGRSFGYTVGRKQNDFWMDGREICDECACDNQTDTRRYILSLPRQRCALAAANRDSYDFVRTQSNYVNVVQFLFRSFSGSYSQQWSSFRSICTIGRMLRNQQ